MARIRSNRQASCSWGQPLIRLADPAAGQVCVQGVLGGRGNELPQLSGHGHTLRPPMRPGHHRPRHPSRHGRTRANDGRDGSQMLPGETPGGDPITYREWDVNPNVKGVDRGGDRIVTGSDGSAYYTNDHYQWFTQFSGSGG